MTRKQRKCLEAVVESRSSYLVTILQGMREPLLRALREISGVIVLEQGYGDGSTTWQVAVATPHRSADELEAGIRSKMNWANWLDVVKQ